MSNLANALTLSLLLLSPLLYSSFVTSFLQPSYKRIDNFSFKSAAPYQSNARKYYRTGVRSMSSLIINPKGTSVKLLGEEDLKESQSKFNTESVQNVKGKMLVSGSMDESHVFQTLNKQRVWEKISCLCADDEEKLLAKKKLVSRNTRYSGLLDILDFEVGNLGNEEEANKLNQYDGWLVLNEYNLLNLAKTAIQSQVKYLVAVISMTEEEIKKGAEVNDLDKVEKMLKEANVQYTLLVSGPVVNADPTGYVRVNTTSTILSEPSALPVAPKEIVTTQAVVKKGKEKNGQVDLDNDKQELKKIGSFSTFPYIHAADLGRLASEFFLVPSEIKKNDVIYVTQGDASVAKYMKYLRQNKGYTYREEIMDQLSGGYDTYEVEAKKEEEKIAQIQMAKKEDSTPDTDMLNKYNEDRKSTLTDSSMPTDVKAKLERKTVLVGQLKIWAREWMELEYRDLYYTQRQGVSQSQYVNANLARGIKMVLESIFTGNDPDRITGWHDPYVGAQKFELPKNVNRSYWKALYKKCYEDITPEDWDTLELVIDKYEVLMQDLRPQSKKLPGLHDVSDEPMIVDFPEEELKKFKMIE